MRKMNASSRKTLPLILLLIFALLFAAGCASVSPLKRAVVDGDLKKVRALIKAGADVEAWKGRGDDHFSPLLFAAAKGRTDIVKALIEAGANVKTYYFGNPLVAAASSGNTETVRVLIKAGVDVNSIGYLDSWSPLMSAASSGNTETVRVLIKAGADVNEIHNYGFTSLIIAASSGHTETVRALISAKADINTKTKTGKTALIIAATEGFTETVRMLISAGADLDVKDIDDNTALELVTRNPLPETAIALIKGGADMNTTDDDGWTPLMEAAVKDHTEIAIALIKAGANVNLRANNGETALDMARKYGNTRIVQVLEGSIRGTRRAERPAQREEQERQPAEQRRSMEALNNALFTAAQRGDLTKAGALIAAGADINAKDSTGGTALMRAAIWGRTKMAQALIRAGADVNVKNNNDFTALMWAEEKRYREIVRLLEEAMGGTRLAAERRRLDAKRKQEERARLAAERRRLLAEKKKREALELVERRKREAEQERLAAQRKREERERQAAERRRLAKLKKEAEELKQRRAILPEKNKIARVPETEWRSSGSGFYLKGTTHIMTNLHVVGSAKSIRVSFPSGETYPGRVVARDANNDVAVVALQGMRAMSGGFLVNLGAEIEPDMKVHAIGYPLGADISIVSGDISSATGPDRSAANFTMTAPINEGNSGGPVIDENGNLIGIAQGGLIRRDVENVRIASKISAVAAALGQALLTRKFSIRVKARKRRFSSREIFRKFSPYVVRIEVR